MIALAIALAAAPALAAGPDNRAVPEARIRHMGSYLEAVADPRRGVYIRAYDGRWYYARTLDECPRLTPTARLRFRTSPGGYFDRNSAIVADGWRCLVSSVVRSDGPAPRQHH